VGFGIFVVLAQFAMVLFAKVASLMLPARILMLICSVAACVHGSQLIGLAVWELAIG
jgi:hypothetical protein